MVEMQFEGLYLEPESDGQINCIVLNEIDGDRKLTLDIGPMESMMISIAMQKERLPRPLTLDLIIFTLRALQAQFIHTIITNVRETMFFALIEISHANKRIRIDCRPSDAIALSLRAARPIFVVDSVLEQAAKLPTRTPGSLALTTPDAATEMVRRTSAKHILDIMNTKQNEHTTNDENQEERLLELLRCLEPATRQKM